MEGLTLPGEVRGYWGVGGRAQKEGRETERDLELTCETTLILL